MNKSIKTGKHAPHILLITGLFGPGGAERVLTLLANQWAARSIRVTAMSLGDTGEMPFFSFDVGVDVCILGLQSKTGNALSGIIRNLGRISTLRQAIQRINPTVVISFLDRTNVLTLLATRGLGIPVIISERTDPAGRNIGRQWELLRRLTYRWADALVCQGQRPLNYFPLHIRNRGHIIPNPVCMTPEAPDLFALKKRNPGTYTVAALGSLRPEKGFDLLLEAFARVSKKHPSWSLNIRGEGSDRKALEALACKLDIKDRVGLSGNTHEPLLQLASADLFVLSSRVEGFPNALTEAMSVGLPVISTDVGAVSEIISNNWDGLIVPTNNVDSLAAAMDRLMGDGIERQRLASNAPNVLDRFCVDNVMSMWEEVISHVTAVKNN